MSSFHGRRPRGPHGERPRPLDEHHRGVPGGVSRRDQQAPRRRDRPRRRCVRRSQDGRETTVSDDGLGAGVPGLAAEGHRADAADGDGRVRIVAIAGDGVGPEVLRSGRAVLDAVGERFGFAIAWSEVLLGGAAIDAYGVAVRPEDIAACAQADAVYLGAVGGPKWDNPNAAVRPEQGLLALRRELVLFGNLRPVSVHPALAGSAPLRPELLAGVGLLVVPE